MMVGRRTNHGGPSQQVSQRDQSWLRRRPSSVPPSAVAAARHAADPAWPRQQGGDGAGFGRALPASTAANAASDGRAAARAPVSHYGGRGRRYHPGRGEHPGGSRVCGDRWDAGSDRPVHAAAADGRVCRPRFLAPPRRRRGLRHRRHTRRGPRRARGRWLAAIRPVGRARGPARRRDATVCAAGPARVPGEFPVPHRAGRIPHRRRYPGGGRPTPRHARGDRHRQKHPDQARGHSARAPTGTRGRSGSVGRRHRDRAGRPGGQPQDPRPADRGVRRDQPELGGGSGGARRGRARPHPTWAAAPGVARPRLA